jgi:RNA polymerase sigma factor (TIGR02999 family)
MLGRPDLGASRTTVSDAETVTRLLLAWSEGDASVRDELTKHVYAELHRIAERHMRAERPDHTLQATALIHEAFLRLVDADVQWTGRAHFFAVAARVMRQILVDHARARGRQRRGGGQIAVTLDEGMLLAADRSEQLLELDDALTRLEALDARKAQAVELHYFGGLTYDEVAAALNTSPATVDRDLRMAKAWLQQELSGG